MDNKKEKTKKKSSLPYRIVIFILCCVFAFSAFKLGTILYEYYQGTHTYHKIEKIAGGLGNIDFDALAKENKDIAAWIYSEGTPINYPVVQGSDNEYYLTHMFNKEWNPKGSIFIDANNPDPFKDFNTIIYGHRMKDRSMFNTLGGYQKEEFYKKHKKMILVTPEQRYDLQIFSVMTIRADSDLYRINFYSDYDKQAYIDRIQSESETPMNVNVDSSDHIVMLSTCTNVDQNERLVVYGKLKKAEKKAPEKKATEKSTNADNGK